MNAGASAVTTCDTSVQSSYLGDIRIFRATELHLTQKQYKTVYLYRDGTQSKTFYENFQYEAESDAMVLAAMPSMPICFNQIERVVAFLPFDDDESPTEASKKFLSGL